MKKSLKQAIALAVALGAAASAHAVNVDQDGHGSVLLYPAYSVENGTSTYVSVTNTTDQYKAVKVRFVEGMNSKEVLDFNLYLSPQDVWHGMVVPTADGAKLTSNDTSCISAHKDGFPAAGMPFRNYLYAGINADAPTEFQGLDRARVGHLEIIEMANLDATAALGNTTVGQAIKHVNGVPGNCAAINAAWNAGGAWSINKDYAVIDDPELAGGLYGTAAIVNVDAGWSSSYDATALANFADTPIHFAPGETSPSLTDASPVAAFKEGTVAGAANGQDAVSAVLMKESIQNDYMIGAGLNAQTDMLITFPTKRLYVNPVAVRPFTEAWNTTTATACEPVEVTYYDTEERSLVLQDEQISPKPPAGEGLTLCHETNVLHISGSNLLGGKFVGHTLDLGSSFEQGWISFDFTGTGRTLPLDIDSTGDLVINGLPAIGFSTVATQNGDVGGLLSNYAQNFAHKATTTVK